MIEAMKQALEALEKISMGGDPRWADDVMPALRQAIEQAEKQEPVAWQDTQKTWVDVPLKNVLNEKREWVGLTDEERYELANVPRWSSVAFVEATEQALKEKNT